LTPALPLLPIIAPLDGESGYLRWKESVLLRLHTLGLAHVLSEEEEDERPADEKQRARSGISSELSEIRSKPKMFRVIPERFWVKSETFR
jgi:hypothetical protein